MRYVTRRVAVVLSERAGLQRVELDDGSRAYSLTDVTGSVAPGDRVVVNTTAADLGLGTGGWHVVHWNLERDSWQHPGGGPVMKVRYTSVQTDCGAAEEDHPGIPAALDGLPVVVCGLHSQLPAVVVAARQERPDARVAYVMTDVAALPLALSDLVAALRSAGLVQLTVTAGQAFGGDLEAVNVASALCLARHVGAADLAVVAMGPGGVGTGSALGFGALEVAAHLDTVGWLGGQPIACLRVSTADARDRHRGVSHHSLTALERAAPGVVVPVPVGPWAARVETALAATSVPARHRIERIEVPDVEALLGRHGLAVTTMTRTPIEDPAFFAAAAAAGVTAAIRTGETGTVQA